MKWIEYKVIQSVVGEETIFATKKVGYSEENLVIAINEAYEGKYEITEDSEAFEKEPLPIELGGTGASTVEAVIANLGLEKVKIGSYKGTGVSGPKNYNILTFDFEPKIIFITCYDEEQAVGLAWIRGLPYGISRIDSDFISRVTIEWNGNSVKWYCSSSDAGSEYRRKQLNVSGYTYYYVAIG